MVEYGLHAGAVCLRCRAKRDDAPWDDDAKIVKDVASDDVGIVRANSRCVCGCELLALTLTVQ